MLYRLKPNGSLDRRFDADGELTLDVGGMNVAFALALQSDGKIVAAGRKGGANSDALVVRLKGGK